MLFGSVRGASPGGACIAEVAIAAWTSFGPSTVVVPCRVGFSGDASLRSPDPGGKGALAASVTGAPVGTLAANAMAVGLMHHRPSSAANTHESKRANRTLGKMPRFTSITSD